MTSLDSFLNDFIQNPIEKNAKIMMKNVATQFHDSSLLTETHFDNLQDLIANKDISLQYGGFSLSDHLSNTLRSCFKHNKRNDLITLLRPTSVNKFIEIDTFGNDTIALIKPDVLRNMPKQQRLSNIKNSDITTLNMQMGGSNSPLSFNSSVNYKSDAPISSTPNFSEEHQPTNTLLGGTLDTISLEFIPTRPYSEALYKKINSSTGINPIDEPMLSIRNRKSTSGPIVRSDSFIKNKLYTFRKKDDINELSLLFSTEKFIGGDIADIEKKVNELEQISTIDFSMITDESQQLMYGNVFITVDCLLKYLSDANVDEAGCQRSVLQHLFVDGNIDMKLYMEDSGEVDINNFVKKSQEMYGFIISFAKQINLNDYDEETKRKIYVTLHNLISSYIEYVTQKIKDFTLVNTSVINVSNDLIFLHNKFIMKEVDDGQSVTELEGLLAEFLTTSKQNIENVNKLTEALSIGPNEQYDPTTISDIKNKAQLLKEKIATLTNISTTMKTNLDNVKDKIKEDNVSANIIEIAKNMELKKS